MNDAKKPALRQLTPSEQAQWSSKLNNDVSAAPLQFARAQDANAPFQISVTNGQAPGGGKTLIIQLQKRPDITKERAIAVAQHALVDVFGKDAGREADCDYRDVAELRKRMGREMVAEEFDNLTVIFNPGVIAAMYRPETVRTRMADSCRRWFELSESW